MLNFGTISGHVWGKTGWLVSFFGVRDPGVSFGRKVIMRNVLSTAQCEIGSWLRPDKTLGCDTIQVVLTMKNVQEIHIYGYTTCSMIQALCCWIPWCSSSSLLRHSWQSKWMSFSVEHILVETYHVRRRKDEIKVLERLGHPKALHAIFLGRCSPIHGRDVGNGAVRDIRARGADDGLEHAPALFLPGWVAGDAVHVPDGFYCFRAKQR